MARIADYLELILLDVVRRPERPAFTRLAGTRARPRARRVRRRPVSASTLGVDARLRRRGEAA